MNIDFFVESVKTHCRSMGISPSKACVESGAGKALMDNVKRGRVPSVDSIQLLARFLGITTSELLGEKIDGSTLIEGDTKRLINLFDELNPEGQERLLETADDMVKSGKYGKKGDQSEVGKKQA